MPQRNQFLRALFFLFLLTCLLMGLVGIVRVPVKAASSSIVISQVYGGGGNAGAPYQNDFVELFNLGSSAVSINGWSIQYATATGNGLFSANVTTLSGSLTPGQYYLVQLASGGAVGNILPTPDAAGTINMSATGGKVVLVNTATGLPCNGGSTPCTATDLASIVDLVGYGTANFFEGSAAAPAPSNTTSDIRVSNGCTDTDINSSDFATGAPNPRNTNSPTNICPPPTVEIIISEVAWMGTQASANDEWIELYNPQPIAIDLLDWRLVNSTGSVDVVLTGTIPSNGFYLLERARDLTVRDVTADQIYSGALADTNDNLTLSQPNGTIMDTANSNGGAWPAGTGSPGFYSMERVVTGGIPAADADAGWISSTNSALWTKHDAANNVIHGTPAGDNWGFTVTATTTPTSTATATSTATPTRTPTVGVCGVGSTPTSVIINEVAWAGTAASTSDEWIELYNPTSSLINLNNWKLRAVDGTPNITLSNFDLLPGKYYLLERTDNTTVSDITADQIFTGDIGNSSEILQLYNSSGVCVDTANSNGGSWPAGSSVTYGSMERRGVVSDSDTAWFTNTGAVANGKDANGNALKGTPKNLNWAYSVTATPSPRPTTTLRPTATRTLTPPPPPPLVGINEFVPRPGHDWNNDGVVNVGDEYIELLNHGVVPVNLSGYSLDDEANIGSLPYRLPSITLQPGERMVFYGKDTGLLLSDGGDGVRLLKPNGQLVDAYNYFVVRYPDESYCRLPDNGGLDDWNQNCYPTPGLPNSLGSGSGNVPITVADEDVSCPIADTLPLDFVLAECDPFGNKIWSRLYWDVKGWLGEIILPNTNSQWDVYGD